MLSCQRHGKTTITVRTASAELFPAKAVTHCLVSQVSLNILRITSRLHDEYLGLNMFCLIVDFLELFVIFRHCRLTGSLPSQRYQHRGRRPVFGSALVCRQRRRNSRDGEIYSERHRWLLQSERPLNLACTRRNEG